jgi:phage shock protein C
MHMNGHRLYRSERDRMLGGVAGGIADYFDLDPSLVRVAWAVLIIGSGGLFLLLYIVMWFVVPEAPPGYAGAPWSASAPATDATAAGPAPTSGEGANATPPPSAPMGSPPPPGSDYWAARRAERRRRRSGEGGILVGAVLIVIGIWFLAQQYLPWVRFADLWPLALILIGLVLLVGALRRGPA